LAPHLRLNWLAILGNRLKTGKSARRSSDSVAKLSIAGTGGPAAFFSRIDLQCFCPSRRFTLAALIQRAFPYTQSQIDLKIAVGADLAPEDAAYQINLAKTERNPDNGKLLEMKANWDLFKPKKVESLK
jgi:hypothetical protein